jgi:GNAT superfamily N-acetyltransferase
LRIRQIDTTSKTDVGTFIDLPLRLYQDCPQWVPPLLPDIKLVFNQHKHPFYLHSTAAFFLAEADGESLGRIAVLDNSNHNRYHGRRDAFFYFFESVNDQPTADRLFGAAADWATSRGLNTLLGPKGFLTSDGLGLLVEGFEHMPAMGMPYNHAYYRDLLVAAGFQKETGYVSGHLSRGHTVPPQLYELADAVRKEHQLRVKSFRGRRELRRWVPRIGKVYNAAFVNNWEYCPITDEELEVIGDHLVAIADPRLIKLLMKADEIIGYLFVFRDISAAIQKTKGRVWPLGWLRLLRALRTTTLVNLNGMGLLPAYQGMGISSVLFAEIARAADTVRYDRAEVVQIEDHNLRSLTNMEMLGVPFHKRHRVYRRDI